jgi:poly(A) polymerase
VARGIAAGPRIAQLLRMVERLWVAEGFPDAARVDALLNEALNTEAP